MENQDITEIKALEKLLIGGAGSLTPIIVDLLRLDPQHVLENITLVYALGWILRVIVLFSVGAFWIYLSGMDERSRSKIFQLGIVAPALLVNLVNNLHTPRDVDANKPTSKVDANKPTSKEVDTHTSFLLIPPAYAQTTKREEPSFHWYGSWQDQFLRGFLGLAPTTAPSLSTAEVRKWLDEYQQALEQKNVSKLVELGVYSSQQVEKVQKIFSRYDHFQVDLQAIDIGPEGDIVKVSFTRADTVNGESMLPVNETFILKKEVDGRVAAIGRG